MSFVERLLDAVLLADADTVTVTAWELPIVTRDSRVIPIGSHPVPPAVLNELLRQATDVSEADAVLQRTGVYAFEIRYDDGDADHVFAGIATGFPTVTSLTFCRAAIVERTPVRTAVKERAVDDDLALPLASELWNDDEN